jgi:hypothetical protein
VKATIYRTWLAIAGGVLLAACSSSTPPESGTSSAVTQLFTLEPTPDRNTLQKTATGYLATLLADPANQEITLVKVDPAVVSNNTQDLAVILPNGKTAQFHLRDYNTITPGIDGWVGYKPSVWKQAHPSSASEIDNDPLYYLSLARDGEKLVGSVTVEGQPYRIEYVSPGQHALIKVDETKLPPEGAPLQVPGAAARDDTIGKVPKSTHSTIRVLFVTTKQVRDKRPNNKVELANALNDANQYMKNSRVAINYELAGYFDADYDETGRNYYQQLEDIYSAKPLGEQVLQWREEIGADLVSMYSTASDYCGMAWIDADKKMAHSVISCASFLAHELGHNLGAHHNWEPGDIERFPPYMYGYRYTGTPRFRTQMSYDCSGGTCPGVPYHSNPRLTYRGVPLGTVEHHDVARRFNERRETVESFYPPLSKKKIRSVERAKLGLPACLTVTSGGALTFTDCEVLDDNVGGKYWDWTNNVLTTLRNQQGATSVCLQYTANGKPAGLGACSGVLANFSFRDGLIKFSFLGMSNCLEGDARNSTPQFNNCYDRDASRWETIP